MSYRWLSWVGVVVVFLLQGLTSTPAHAAGGASPLAPAVDREDGAPRVVRVKARKDAGARGSSKSDMQVLKGDVAWLVAGAAGTLVPLVLLALPLIWSPWAGPVWWVPLMVVALVWGGLTVGAGGALAWLIMAVFSDTRSGWLIPVAAAAGVGVAGVALSGVAAAVVFLPFYLLGAFWTGEVYRNRPDYYFYGWYWTPFGWLAGVLAFTVWAVGVVATSLAGPVLAAWLYKRLGQPRRGNDISWNPTTSRSLDEDLAELSQDAGADNGGDRGSGTRARSSAPKARKGSGSSAQEGGTQKAPPRRSGARAARPAPRDVGGPCSSEQDCDGRCAVGDAFGGGMCTRACSRDAACPGGTQCVDTHGGICVPSCTADGDCSQGRVCRAMASMSGADARVCVQP